MVPELLGKELELPEALQSEAAQCPESSSRIRSETSCRKTRPAAAAGATPAPTKAALVVSGPVGRRTVGQSPPPGPVSRASVPPPLGIVMVQVNGQPAGPRGPSETHAIEQLRDCLGLGRGSRLDNEASIPFSAGPSHRGNLTWSWVNSKVRSRPTAPCASADLLE